MFWTCTITDMDWLDSPAMICIMQIRQPLSVPQFCPAPAATPSPCGHPCLLLQVSGQKFYYLRGAGALLELALINYAISKVG